MYHSPAMHTVTDRVLSVRYAEEENEEEEEEDEEEEEEEKLSARALSAAMCSPSRVHRWRYPEGRVTVTVIIDVTMSRAIIIHQRCIYTTMYPLTKECTVEM